MLIGLVMQMTGSQPQATCLVSGAPVSWRSKKQTCVTLSTAEAEYVALSQAIQEVTWLRELFKDLHNKQTNHFRRKPSSHKYCRVTTISQQDQAH